MADEERATRFTGKSKYDRGLILRLIDEGKLSGRQIAAVVGCSEKTISLYKNGYGEVWKTQYYTDDMIARAIAHSDRMVKRHLKRLRMLQSVKMERELKRKRLANVDAQVRPHKDS